MSQQIPQNNSAEESLLGAVLLRPIILGELRDTLDPSDFYRAQFQAIYAAMLSLHAIGMPIDVVTVAAQVNDPEIDARMLSSLTAATPSTSAFHRYADLIIDSSRRRRAINFWSEMIDDAYAVGNDFDAVLGRSDASADRLIAPRAVNIKDLYQVGDFMEMATKLDAARPWLIPHLLKSMWRAILVGFEGQGKTTLMRMLALHAAAGRDVWSPTKFVEPRRCLYVDCENASSSIALQLRVSNTMFVRESSVIEEAHDNLFIWHREQGVNLRARKPQAEFEATLERTQPEIVFMGPLRKLFRRTGREDMEQVALEVQDYFDGLRKRFGFALVIEHHVPKGSHGQRDLIPFGSGTWMGWPEFGITLEPKGNVTPEDTQYTLELGRFRGDREIADWPTEITRGAFGAHTAWSPFWKFGQTQKLIDNDVPF